MITVESGTTTHVTISMMYGNDDASMYNSILTHEVSWRRKQSVGDYDDVMECVKDYVYASHALTCT